MLEKTRLFDFADYVLDLVVAHYAAEGVALPTRQYVAPGQPALDCEQITVHVERDFTQEGDVVVEVQQAIRGHVGHQLLAAVFVISIWRCTPTFDDAGNPPTAAALQLSGGEVLQDAIMMSNAILDADNNGLLGDNLIAILGWTGVEPNGAFAGGFLRVTLGLQRIPGGS